MPFFLLTYRGPRSWNHDQARVVCARSLEDSMRAVPVRELNDWTSEAIEDEPGDFPDTILSAWVGDAY